MIKLQDSNIQNPIVIIAMLWGPITVLQVSKLTAHLRFTTPAKLQYWMGSAFRGAFGQNLRQICCVDFKKECNECSVRDSCLFFYVFFREKARRGHAAPIKPVILIPPFFGKEMHFKQDGRLTLDILVLGDFKKYLPHVIFGLTLIGKRGIGSVRYEDVNRFVVESIESPLQGKVIYDGESINLNNFNPVDVIDLNGVEKDAFEVRFRTPFTGKEFPPGPERFLKLVRNRLIRFVNEYGTQEKVPDFIAEGEIEKASRHFHELERKSSRSDKTLFKSHTGIVSYKYSYLNQSARWLLNVATIIGCGPDASFGCGFLEIE